jgi:hypothetical protein
MADRGPIRHGALRAIPACFAIAFLAGCGNTGDLYLPEPGTSGEVVTRPAPTPPVPDAAGGANSPQTADSPAVPPTPAPEVTEPEPDEDKEDAAEPRQ